MSRRSTPCTQADLTRLIKAALAAGVGVERLAGVKLTNDGAVLLFGEQKLLQPGASENEWDEVLAR
jgi:hypothetical protein